MARKRTVKRTDPLERDAEVASGIRRDDARIRRDSESEGVRLRRDAGETVEFLGSEIGRPGDERSHTRQIADALLCAIAAGRWKAGALLPSTAAIARQLGVNPNTAARAYAVVSVDGACSRSGGRWVVASLSKARDAVVSAVLEAERRAEEMRRLAWLP